MRIPKELTKSIRYFGDNVLHLKQNLHMVGFSLSQPANLML